jgi:outer membrane immunogenic protein
MMKHLAQTACMALLALAAVPASGADLGRMPTKAPVAAPIAPAVTWTGCYIGGNVGGGWAREKYTDPLAPAAEAFLGSHTASGVVGGGQVGCDYQFGQFVIGARGMFDAADLKGNHLLPGEGDVFDTRIPWFATATGRLGWAFQPNFLLYVKGGGAWKRQEETITDLGVVEGVARRDRSGWDVGGGFEWQFFPGWSVFAEFNYMDFGTKRISFTAPGAAPFPLDIREQISMAVVGVNWRFNFFR